MVVETSSLFRHPFGLPIPHVAIVRRKKEGIGAAVASFVRKSFLTPEEVARQWYDWRPRGVATPRCGDGMRVIFWCLRQSRGASFLGG